MKTFLVEYIVGEIVAEIIADSYAMNKAFRERIESVLPKNRTLIGIGLTADNNLFVLAKSANGVEYKSLYTINGELLKEEEPLNEI